MVDIIKVLAKSGDPESNQGPSDVGATLQSDALPTELSPVLVLCCSASYLMNWFPRNFVAQHATPVARHAIS